MSRPRSPSTTTTSSAKKPKVKEEVDLFRSRHTWEDEKKALTTFHQFQEAFQHLGYTEWCVLNKAIRLAYLDVSNQSTPSLMSAYAIHDKNMADLTIRFSAPTHQQYVPFTLIREVLNSMTFQPLSTPFVMAVRLLKTAINAGEELWIKFSTTEERPIQNDETYLLDWIREFDDSRIKLSVKPRPYGYQAHLVKPKDQGLSQVTVSVLEVVTPHFTYEGNSFAHHVQAELVTKKPVQ